MSRIRISIVRSSPLRPCAFEPYWKKGWVSFAADFADLVMDFKSH